MPAAGAVKVKLSEFTATVWVVVSPRAPTVTVSLPPLAAVMHESGADPVESVVTELALSVLARAEATVTTRPAMAWLAESSSVDPIGALLIQRQGVRSLDRQ